MTDFCIFFGKLCVATYTKLTMPNFIESLKDTNNNKEVPFSPEEWDEFCQEFEHSPKEALAKAYSRGHYPTPEQS